MSKLLPLKTDCVFKRVFGHESRNRVLVCLLNSILNGKPHIKPLELGPTEKVKDKLEGKSAHLDIAATADDGTRINIEIQCINTGNIADRAAFYQSKMMKEELKEGENYNLLPNVITIWIVDETVTKRKSPVNEIVNMYKANGIDEVEIASEKMRKFIIELTKIDSKYTFVSDMFMVWMMFIKDPESVPEELLEIPEVQEAMDELKYVSQSNEAREEYNARQKEINDIHAAITTKYLEGMEKGKDEGKLEGRIEGEQIGIEKGKVEGANEKAVKVAKSLLIAGVDINIISASTWLLIEEIEKLM